MTSELLKLQTIFLKSISEILEDLDESSIDNVLNNRDLDLFSDVWINAFNNTKQNVINEDDKKLIDEVRKEVLC